MERRLVSIVRAAAAVLGSVEREVGIAHQRFDCRAVVRADGRTDAGANVERMMVYLVGL